MKLNSPIAFLKVLLLFVTVLIASCARKGELNVAEDQEATINLSLPETRLRGGSLFAGDQEITKVRILVFKGEGLDVQQLFIANTSAFTNPFSLVAHAGLRKIYVVANESDALGTRLSHHSALSTDQVQIRKVLINRLAKTEPLIPRSTAFPLGTPWEWTKVETMALVNNDTEYKPYIKEEEPLYVYENLGSSADSTGRAPILMIEALYNGIATNYYAYVNDKNSSADHHYSIKRNHHYMLKGDITKVGESPFLMLTTEVLPWDVEELEHKILEPQQGKLEPGSVFPGPNYTSKEHPFSVTIRIKATEGSHWKATLTNGLEFALQGDTSGDTNVDRDYTVTIVPLKVPGNKPRKTELYFTVDGKEVVLKKEGGLRLTRIEIIQKSKF